jgi:tRNA (guanine37-N1)-methyltransferase
MARGVRSWCVVVPRDRGEEIRLRLKERELLQKHLKVREERGRLFLPTTERVELGFPTEERECEEAFVPIRSYKDVVRVPDPVRGLLPTAFDVIGDIAVLKIPDPLLPYRSEIGRAILQWNRTLRVVAQDRGVTGKFRVRDLEIIAGERRTSTVHTEFGLRYRADVAHAYFSPRLGSERLRVAKLVASGETVADPFAGVGPYALLIAKRREPMRVIASDANPVAVGFLRRNVAANHADRVEVREGDARLVLREVAPVDRIILDLPHSAMDFVPDAVAALGPRGTIHVYGILDDADRDERINAIRAIVEGQGRRVLSIRAHVVRPYSPTQHHVAFDVTVGPTSGRAAPGRTRSASRKSKRRPTPTSGRRAGRSARRSGARGSRRTR